MVGADRSAQEGPGRAGVNDLSQPDPAAGWFRSSLRTGLNSFQEWLEKTGKTLSAGPDAHQLREAPQCAVTRLPDTRFVIGGTNLAHVECWLQWVLAKHPEPYIVEVLLVTFRSGSVEAGVEDDRSVAAICSHSSDRTRVTVLPAVKSRFPAMGLASLADLCGSIQEWLTRPSVSPAPPGVVQFRQRYVYLAGSSGAASRALFVYIAFQAWMPPSDAIVTSESEDVCLPGEDTVLPASPDANPAPDANATMNLSTVSQNSQKNVSQNEVSQNEISQGGDVVNQQPLAHLASVFDSLEKLEKARLNSPDWRERLVITNTFHPFCSVDPSILFASQKRFLKSWFQLIKQFRCDFTPSAIELRQIRITGLSLQINDPSKSQLPVTVTHDGGHVSNSLPVVEILLSNTALWSSKPSHSIAWAFNIEPADVTPLKIIPGPLHRTATQTTWTVSFLNPPKVSGDVLFRLLPASEDAYDTLFAMERTSITVPQWMLRIQMHASEFTDCQTTSPTGKCTQIFKNADIDGYDLILGSLSRRRGLSAKPTAGALTDKICPVPCEVTITLTVEVSPDIKESPVMENVRRQVQSAMTLSSI